MSINAKINWGFDALNQPTISGLLRGGGKAGEGEGGGGVQSKALRNLERCGAGLKITPAGQQKMSGQNDHYSHNSANYKDS